MDDILLIGCVGGITLSVIVMILRHLKLKLIFFPIGIAKKCVDIKLYLGAPISKS